MDVESGNVMSEDLMRELYGNKGFEEKVENGLVVPVDKEKMTTAQLNRMESGAQPVVKQKDTRSYLALKQAEAKKVIANRRAKNKLAKKARKKNR
jgi:hypothetical protein